MAAEQRDFTDFEAFPGEVTDGQNYEFPALWHKDSMDRMRYWQIVVRMIKKAAPLSGIDWDLLAENQVPVKKEYFALGTKIPASIVAEAWAETGILDGKITRNAPTYFETPLNLGKSNERNVFQNALIYARAQWLKRKEKGGETTQKTAIKHANDKHSQSDKHSRDDKHANGEGHTMVMYFPMLAKTFKDGEKHLVFPLWIQPKLDGVRMLVFLQKKNGGVSSVVAYTRTRKLFPNVDYIKKAIYPYLNALYDEEQNQSIYFDGELYLHGKALQDISGDSRRSTDSKASKNEYHVYDCFYPKELDTPFEKRHRQLLAYYDAIKPADAAILKSVPCILIKNLQQADKQYKKFVSMGYEGAILRNSQGVYASDAHKTGAFLRSKDLVKMKPRFSDEYEVVGYTEGSRGKDKGAIVWICKTPGKNGQEFNVTPKDITYEKRYELFAEAKTHFEERFNHRMMTVEYEDISKAGVPLRAKAVAFRDYE